MKPETGALIEESLRAGREIPFAIRTGSMHPMLKVGDKVLVRAASSVGPNVGEVVLRKAGNGNGWLAHRLVDKWSESGRVRLRTKGDNTPAADEAWEAEELLGVVVGIDSGECQVSLNSRGARWANLWIARLSLLEAAVFGGRSSPLRALSLRLLTLSLRFAGRVTRYCVGLG